MVILQKSGQEAPDFPLRCLASVNNLRCQRDKSITRQVNNWQFMIVAGHVPKGRGTRGELPRGSRSDERMDETVMKGKQGGLTWINAAAEVCATI
jgi:hypothetical protein